MITVNNQLVVIRTCVLLLFISSYFIPSQLFSQGTVSLTVTGGEATTTCNDVFSGPDPRWAVDVQYTGYEHYLGNPFCFNTLPNIQFSQQITCLPELPTIDVCFKAFENDGLFCNTDETCLTETCARFNVPFSGSVDYTLSLPNDLPSGGYVNFTIETDGMLIDQGNDNMCGAIDLGILNNGQQLGDATQDIYNNYCADGIDEPSTSAAGAGWGNDFSVWFTFTTSNDPSSIASILGISDPENTGEYLNLQLALFQSTTADCMGDFEFVTSSWNNNDVDELMVTNCLEANRTYYILVDGFITPPTTRFNGLFGLQVNDEGVKEAPDQICEATDLGNIPLAGQVTTGLTFSNLCATGETSDPQNSIFPADNSVWFTFQAPDSRHVLITAISDENRANGGLDAVDIQLAVFSTDNGNCSGNFTEQAAGYDPNGLDENLELSCLIPGETYYFLLNGGPIDQEGVFSITISDAGYDPIIETIDEVICFGDSLLVGDTYLTVGGPINIPLITQEGCDSLIEGSLTVLPQNLVIIDSTICAGTEIEIAGNSYNTTGTFTDVITGFSGCDSTIITNLVITESLDLIVDQTVEATGYQILDGVASANVTGGNPPYTYQWENGENSSVAANLPGGSDYCLTVTDAMGCTVEDCILILFPSNIIVEVQNDLLDCPNDMDGTLSVQISNGAIPYNYEWENGAGTLSGTGTVSTEGGIAILNGLTAGNYSFPITDAFGIKVANGVVVDPPPIITNLNETICFGDSILVGENYYKTQGPILENLISYSGCDSTVTGLLNVLPFVGETVNETLCFGDSLQVGNVYYNGNGPILEILIDQNGCDSVITGNLTILPEIITTINPLICFGESFEIGNSILQNSGTFTEIFLAQNGCDSTVVINLIVLEELVVTSILDSEASGLGEADGTASASVISGSGNISYQWSDGNTSSVITDLIGGQTYCVTVTNLDANCIAEDCVTILFPVDIQTNSTDDFLDCFGANDGQISFSVSNGQPPYDFTWIGDNGSSGNGIVTTEGGIGIIDNLSAGIYQITISDIWGETIINGLVEEPDLMLITETNNMAASCFGNCDGALELMINGGAAPYTFSWPDGQNTSNVTGLCQGTYQVTVIDANNCISTNVFTVNEPNDFQSQIIDSQSVRCFGEDDGQAIVTSNIPAVSYLWDNGEITQEAINLSAGLHSVTVTNSDGCTSIAEVTISSPVTPITVDVITIQPISCSDATDGIIGVDVTASVGELLYEWSTGSTNPSLENVASGFYEVTVTDENGCVGIASSEITTGPPIEPSFRVEDITCLSGVNSGRIMIDTIIGGSPPFLFSLDPEQGFSTVQSFGFLAAGSYELFIEEMSGCLTEVPFVVNAPEELVVTLGEDETIELGEEISIEAISNSNDLIFTWELLDPAICSNCQEFTAAPLFSRMYQIMVTDTITNCFASDEKLVTVQKRRNVYIPNSFSPNGDGLNDLFTVATGEDVANILSLKIFNRWGAQIYGIENMGPDELIGWDGNFGGEKADVGIYVFVSEVLFKDGFKQIYRGDLTLFR